MSKLKKGFVLGSLIGAGLLWLNTTKKGKVVRDQALTHAEDVYERVKDRVFASEAWDEMSRSRFGEIVSEVADEYTRERGLADNAKAIVVKIVNAQWGHLRKGAAGKKKAV